MHQTCKHCGFDQRFEFSLKDSVWQLLPKDWQTQELCIECFLYLLECELVEPYEFKPDDFVFLAIVGTDTLGEVKVHGILKDSVK